MIYSIKKTRAICEKATPINRTLWRSEGSRVLSAEKMAGAICLCDSKHDAEFIAHARTALPIANELLKKMEELCYDIIHSKTFESVPESEITRAEELLAQLEK